MTFFSIFAIFYLRAPYNTCSIPISSFLSEFERERKREQSSNLNEGTFDWELSIEWMALEVVDGSGPSFHNPPHSQTIYSNCKKPSILPLTLSLSLLFTHSINHCDSFFSLSLFSDELNGVAEKPKNKWWWLLSPHPGLSEKEFFWINVWMNHGVDVVEFEYATCDSNFSRFHHLILSAPFWLPMKPFFQPITSALTLQLSIRYSTWKISSSLPSPTLLGKVGEDNLQNIIKRKRGRMSNLFTKDTLK